MANYLPVEDILVNMPSTIQGLNISYVGTTTFSVSAGVCRDSTNTNEIRLAAATTVTGTHVGVNGVDVAAIVASNVYAVYVIGDATNKVAPACLMSLNLTTPQMPVGYNLYRRIGYVVTDSSVHFLKIYQVGNYNVRQYQFDGTQTLTASGTSATFATLDASASVPWLGYVPVQFNTFFTPNAAGDEWAFRPAGSADANGIALGGPVASKESVDVFWTFVNGGEIDYKVAASGAVGIYIVGFIDYL